MAGGLDSVAEARQERAAWRREGFWRLGEASLETTSTKPLSLNICKALGEASTRFQSKSRAWTRAGVTGSSLELLELLIGLQLVGKEVKNRDRGVIMSWPTKPSAVSG